jgi:alpha/beta superfamily hydrolase
MDRYDYSFLAEAKKPIFVVQGENDEFGAGDTVAALLSELGAHIALVRIPGTDHYFTDRLDELRATIRGYYESGPGSRTLAIV